MNKIGYCTVGLGDRDVESALDAIAAAGFDGAEIMGEEPHVAAPLKGQALTAFRRGLETRRLDVSVHAPLGRSVLGAPEEEWRREKVAVLGEYLRFSGAIGAEEMVVHPVPNPTFVPSPDDPELPSIMREALSRSLDELIPVAEKSGVRILFENLPYNCDYPFLAMSELRRAVDPYPAVHLGLVIDTGHAVLSGLDVAEEIRAAAGRLNGTHLHDTDGTKDFHWSPGEGMIDWSAVRRALAEIDYAGPWTFEAITLRTGETPDELCLRTRATAARWRDAGSDSLENLVLKGPKG